MSIITGTECGPPSGSRVAMWATFGPANRARASSLSTVIPSPPGHRRMLRLAVMVPQPVDVVGHGALDVVLRAEAGVRSQPGGVEVAVQRPVGIVTRREGDVRARNSGVDRVDE